MEQRLNQKCSACSASFLEGRRPSLPLFCSSPPQSQVMDILLFALNPKLHIYSHRSQSDASIGALSASGLCVLRCDRFCQKFLSAFLAQKDFLNDAPSTWAMDTLTAFKDLDARDGYPAVAPFPSRGSCSFL